MGMQDVQCTVVPNTVSPLNTGHFYTYLNKRIAMHFIDLNYNQNNILTIYIL